LTLCVFFVYNSPGGDRYRLEISGKNRMYLVHENAGGEIDGGKVELRGDSDERRIEAGLNAVDELASDLPALNESVEAAKAGLEECRRLMTLPNRN
jgi:hypothetical protein